MTPTPESSLDGVRLRQLLAMAYTRGAQDWDAAHGRFKHSEWTALRDKCAVELSCLEPLPVSGEDGVEPVEAVEAMVMDLLDTSNVADPQMRRKAAAMLMRVCAATHPAPQAAAGVSVTDEMVEAAADALERQFVAGGPDVPWDKAARAALEAALSLKQEEGR